MVSEISWYLLAEQPHDIKTIGKDQQSQYDREPNIGGIFHKLVARFFASDHFPNQEHHVPTVQCGNGR